MRYSIFKLGSFYTYLWLREDGTPYYVGKGRAYRAFDDKHTCHPPTDKSRIIIQEHPDESSAFKAERFLIEYYGRLDLGTGCLRNRTIGGEGQSGRVVSIETRKKLSDRVITDNWKYKLSVSAIGNRNALGHKVSVEARKKMGAATKDKPWSEARRAAHKRENEPQI